MHLVKNIQNSSKYVLYETSLRAVSCLLRVSGGGGFGLGGPGLGDPGLGGGGD